jgi:hypothetical protein
MTSPKETALSLAVEIARDMKLFKDVEHYKYNEKEFYDRIDDLKVIARRLETFWDEERDKSSC